MLTKTLFINIQFLNCEQEINNKNRGPVKLIKKNNYFLSNLRVSKIDYVNELPNYVDTTCFRCKEHSRH